MNRDQTIKDSVKQGWVESMPESVRPYLRLSRYDRPIGFWLLALPGWIGLAIAALTHGFSWDDLKYAVLIAIGAIAMRGAGCTYNDIVDKDLDASVDRTALRPLPAGTVSVKSAWIWIGVQCAVGAAVLAFFPRFAQIIAVSSLAMVAAYPFMKRITYWPQAWLGLTFNWAVLVAYTAKVGTVTPALLLLYAGLVFWTIGYDTIYACQDKEDDALIGIKSTARLFGDKTKLWVGILYSVCLFLLALAIYLAAAEPILICVLLPFAFHLLWQTTTLEHKDGELCLKLFKSNRLAALLLIASLSSALPIFRPY
jgi:4-hydroxybenzoate polyprenyltransferase